MPSSTTPMLLAAMSDLALNRLLHYRMPSPPALVQMLPVLSKCEANRLLLLYADVLREQGICLDDLKFVVPPQLVAHDMVSGDATKASDSCAADAQSLDSTFDDCDDSSDSWDTATSGSYAHDEDASPDVTNVQSAPVVWWTQAGKALWDMQHNHNTWAETVSLRDVARMLKLDEAVIWFDTDGQAPARVRLERYQKPLVDLSPI